MPCIFGVLASSAKLLIFARVAGEFALAANGRSPPFVSKSAWRSNLTDSLSHNYRERPITAIHDGVCCFGAASAKRPLVEGAET
jgi:hypothetical protein